LRLAVSTLLEALSLALASATTILVVLPASTQQSVVAVLGAGAVACITAAIWFAHRRREHTPAAAAAVIERHHRDFHNVIVTAIELREHPERSSPWVRQRVFSDAETLLAQVTPGAIVQVGRRVMLVVGAAVIATTVALGLHERAVESVRTLVGRGGNDAAAIAPDAITITIQPPPYTRRPPARLANPERIDAIEGSEAHIELPPGSSIRFGSLSLPVTNIDGATSAEMSLFSPGYLAITSRRRVTLIPVTVSPDRPPSIRVEQPGRDLLVVRPSDSIEVAASVTDDFGVADVRLRYTRVSGSGEQFAFREGELPLTTAQDDPQAWHTRGTFSLPRLALEPGDALVYQFVARDGREGTRGTAVSDSFLIERPGPGQVALEGFEMPPDGERYALSQQMIVLKIERLRGEQARLTRVEARERGADIGAEQRAVKANFVFLMGGHIEDEEVEAEQSSEIQEGRLQNTGRREIGRAIDHMTRAEQALASMETKAALREARSAVESLQRAFGQNRYILRTFAARDRIDVSRRLSGNLDAARSSTRASHGMEVDGRLAAIGPLFVTLTAILDDLQAERPVDARLAVLSERVLAIDPSNPAWQRLARELAAVREAVAAGAKSDTAASRLREASAVVVAEGRRLALAPSHVSDTSTLRGAWADALATSRTTK
jgi:hypothetical protein